MSFSLMFKANVFHELHPIVGVRCADAVVAASSSKKVNSFFMFIKDSMFE